MTDARWPATFRALRHRNYRLYFFGQMVSLTGTWLQSTALGWLAYSLTGLSSWPGRITAAQILPTFLLGAWGGLLADRWPKRSLIMATQVAFMALALTLAGLVYWGTLAPWQMLLITFLSGVVQAVDLPARLAFVTDLAGREDLRNAVALNSTLFNVARALGPALAGVVFTALGPAPCFLLNGLSYVAVLGALAGMTARGGPHPEAARRGGSVFDGLAHLAGDPNLATLTALAGVMCFCGWPSQALLPALARDHLGLDSQAYSWMLSGTGLGALAAALTVATLSNRIRARYFLAGGVGVLWAALTGLSLAPTLGVAVVFCALIGFGLIAFLATGQGVVQLSAPDQARGRVMGVWAITLSGAMPLGNLLFTPLADAWDEPQVLRLQGACCAAAALALVALHQYRVARRARPG